jgi:glycosyltransferase involved in cell wall biosynthesis
MRVLCLFDGVTGVAFHRLYTPYARLQLDEGITVDVSTNQDEWVNLDYTKYDVLVFNRWLGQYQYNIFPILEKANLPFICDVDDYWVLPKYNPSYKFYRTYIKNGIKDALTFANAVTCTTPQLKEKCEELNDNVHILPNAIDLEQPQWNKQTDHTPTIGWVGGLSHTYDIQLLREQIKPICEEHGYRFIMGGHHEGHKVWYEMEKYITNEDRTNRPKWFEKREGTTANKYGEFYSEIDIALAPLTKEKFNRYKSELKILEAAAYKLPIFVSDVEPYTNHRDNLGVCFVQKNDWSEITKLIESGRMQEVGQANYDYCNEHHNLKEINKKRLDILQSVCK